MGTILYGINNCDTVKKARRWLDSHGVGYRFHDLRTDGLDEERLRAWVVALGWEALLNRRSTTWRQLAESDKADLDGGKTLALMLKHPTLIKRPVLEINGGFMVGFREADYSRLFS